MSADHNKSITRRVFEEVFNTGNVDLMDRLASPDLRVHYGAASGSVDGLEAYKQHYAASRPALPDAHFTIEDMIAEGDKVVTRWTMRATHKGAVLGIPATGKLVTETGISIYRVEEGRVVEAWVSADDLGLLQQFGAVAIPEPAA